MAFSGYQDFDPRFSAALQAYVNGNAGISVFSGYRSPEHQAELFNAAVAKYGSEEAARKWVAPPGHSFHNQGLAADLHFADDAARAAAHANAAQYGLAFPLANEPWHIELAGARGMGNRAGGQAWQPGDMAGAPFDPFRGRVPASGLFDMPQGTGDVYAPIGPRPINSMGDFLEQQIAGENPLRSMVYSKILGMFA